LQSFTIMSLVYAFVLPHSTTDSEHVIRNNVIRNQQLPRPILRITRKSLHIVEQSHETEVHVQLLVAVE